MVALLDQFTVPFFRFVGPICFGKFMTSWMHMEEGKYVFIMIKSVLYYVMCVYGLLVGKMCHCDGEVRWWINLVKIVPFTIFSFPWIWNFVKY